MSAPSVTHKLSSTQIGAIGENLLVNTVMKASKGRLSPFKPVADDDGLDLLFFDKETGNSVAIQLKCRADTDRRGNSKVRGSTAQFDVRKATFKEARSAYLVAALFNEDKTDFVCTWFISMEELHEVGKLRSDKYVIAPSKAGDSKDKYVKYRCKTENLAQHIIDICSRHASDTVPVDSAKPQAGHPKVSLLSNEPALAGGDSNKLTCKLLSRTGIAQPLQ